MHSELPRHLWKAHLASKVLQACLLLELLGLVTLSELVRHVSHVDSERIHTLIRLEILIVEVLHLLHAVHHHELAAVLVHWKLRIAEEWYRLVGVRQVLIHEAGAKVHVVWHASLESVEVVRHHVLRIELLLHLCLVRQHELLALSVGVGLHPLAQLVAVQHVLADLLGDLIRCCVGTWLTWTLTWWHGRVLLESYPHEIDGNRGLVLSLVLLLRKEVWLLRDLDVGVDHLASCCIAPPVAWTT